MSRKKNIELVIEENRDAETYEQVLKSVQRMFPFKCELTITDYAKSAWRIIVRDRNAKS
jgi:methyl coenzyme M reductase subunit D